jgi:hypothetical protein
VVTSLEELEIDERGDVSLRGENPKGWKKRGDEQWRSQEVVFLDSSDLLMS